MIGINTAIIAGAQGLCFAVAANTAQLVLGQLVRFGRVRRAALGLTGQREAVPRRFARPLGVEQATGLLVAAVQPGGPAARAGIERGDLLLTIGGLPVTGVDALLRWLTGERVGEAGRGAAAAPRRSAPAGSVVPAERDRSRTAPGRAVHRYTGRPRKLSTGGLLAGRRRPGRCRSSPAAPPLLLFWTSRVLSTLCMQMLAVAVGWQLYALTGRASTSAWSGWCSSSRCSVLTLPAGWLADRGDRRLIVACCQGIVAVLAAVLAFGTLRGWLGRETIFLLIGLIGCARAVEAPNMASLLPGLVPRALFPRAAAWSASATQTAQILGPALGGLLYALGPQAAYGTAAVLLLVGSGAAAAIRLPRRIPGVERPGLAGLLSGFRFVLRHRIVLGAISLDLFAVCSAGRSALMPIFARDILGTGPSGLGMLRAAPAVGVAGDLDLAGEPAAAGAGRAADVRGTRRLRGGDGDLRAFGEPVRCPAWRWRWWVRPMWSAWWCGRHWCSCDAGRDARAGLGGEFAVRRRLEPARRFPRRLGCGAAGAVPAAVLGGVGTLIVAALWMRIFPELRRLEKLEG